MDWNQLTDMQQLAVLQALYKQLAEQVSTKDPDSLRAHVDEQVVDWYRATGAKSFDINAPSGMKVGTFSVSISKEVPEKRQTVFETEDVDAFVAWLKGDGAQSAIDFACCYADEFALWLTATTGELPEGIAATEVVTPARPPQVKGTTLRVDVPKVASAFRAELPSAVAGLLGGGER